MFCPNSSKDLENWRNCISWLAFVRKYLACVSSAGDASISYRGCMASFDVMSTCEYQKSQPENMRTKWHQSTMLETEVRYWRMLNLLIERAMSESKTVSHTPHHVILIKPRTRLPASSLSTFITKRIIQITSRALRVFSVFWYAYTGTVKIE